MSLNCTHLLTDGEHPYGIRVPLAEDASQGLDAQSLLQQFHVNSRQRSRIAKAIRSMDDKFGYCFLEDDRIIHDVQVAII